MQATVRARYTNEFGDADYEVYEMETVKRAREMGKFMYECGAECVVITKDNGEQFVL